MQKQLRKIGRPRKTSIGVRPHPLNLQISDEVYRPLKKAADSAGRSLNDEARRRIAQSFEIEKVSYGNFDMGDAIRAARYAAVLQEAVAAAGDDTDWRTYAGAVPAMINLDDADEVNRIRAMVRVAVDAFLAEATAYLERHGDPPAGALKHPFGTPPEVKEGMTQQRAMHRYFATKRSEILKRREELGRETDDGTSPAAGADE